MYTNDNTIFNSIENLYNMNGQSWREVLATLYKNFGDLENAFKELENKFSEYAYTVCSNSPIGVIKPTRIGQEMFDSTNKVWYKSVGLTNQDWKQISN